MLMKPILNEHLISEYKSRINRVYDYIEQNIHKTLTLEELASIANFSKFHFTRIFWAMTGETPFQFITRFRLERAANLLVYNRKESIFGIALKCGFSDISVFSRNFKAYFGISASEWRRKKQYSNINQQRHNKSQRAPDTSMYFCRETNTIKWSSTMKLNQSVEVKNLPKMTVAYIRHTGPYKGDEKLFERLFNQLFAWAGPRELMQQPDMKMLVIYHDDPSVTEEKNLRMSVCMTIPEDTKVDGEIGKMTIDGGKYAVARFMLTSKDYEQAWSWLYGTWFPSSGYQPDDGPCFEMYTEEAKDGETKVDICIPVKPL